MLDRRVKQKPAERHELVLPTYFELMSVFMFGLLCD